MIAGKATLLQAVNVRQAIVRQHPRNVEQVDHHLIALLEQHTRHGHRISPVVARAGKDHHAVGLVETGTNLVGNQGSRFLHQVNGQYRIMSDGICIRLFLLQTT